MSNVSNTIEVPSIIATKQHVIFLYEQIYLININVCHPLGVNTYWRVTTISFNTTVLINKYVNLQRCKCYYGHGIHTQFHIYITLNCCNATFECIRDRFPTCSLRHTSGAVRLVITLYQIWFPVNWINVILFNICVCHYMSCFIK